MPLVHIPVIYPWDYRCMTPTPGFMWELGTRTHVLNMYSALYWVIIQTSSLDFLISLLLVCSLNYEQISLFSANEKSDMWPSDPCDLASCTLFFWFALTNWPTAYVPWSFKNPAIITLSYDVSCCLQCFPYFYSRYFFSSNILSPLSSFLKQYFLKKVLSTSLTYCICITAII